MVINLINVVKNLIYATPAVKGLTLKALSTATHKFVLIKILFFQNLNKNICQSNNFNAH